MVKSLMQKYIKEDIKEKSQIEKKQRKWYKRKQNSLIMITYNRITLVLVELFFA